MTDIFDNTILCSKCNSKMNPFTIEHNGFILRAVKCPKCSSKIIHPRDEQEYQNFLNLKKKEFVVKMRFVGNSYAVSIPKEIVNFMKEQEKIMDDMVKLCFEESGRISINFNNENNKINTDENNKSRIIQAKEYRVVNNNKPVLHVKQLYDSANPKNNKVQIFRNNENLKETKNNDRKTN